MKNIIITGANGNLGTAVVKKFLDEGYRVIAVDNGDSHLGFAKSNPNFQFKTVDLSKEDAASDFVQEIILSFKQIDGALLLVGGFAMGGIDKTSGADIDKMINLNFKTAFFITRPVFQHMIGNGSGRLVLVGARPALKPEQGKGVLAYALSKSLLFKLAEILNAEAKGKNVVTSVIAPSTIDTPENRKSMPDVNPSNWVRPEQIADVLEFICSEKASVLREPIYKVYNNA
jgi:NAD(P)-dependent dehydrogenase (short-subunit alcohol dehydrogenase family)